MLNEEQAAGGELLPCPFCGSYDLTHSNNKPTFWHHWVKCNACDASSDATGGTKNAIAKWNRRAAASSGASDAPQGVDFALAADMLRAYVECVKEHAAGVLDVWHYLPQVEDMADSIAALTQPAAEAPNAEHKGMTIAGDGAAMLGALMREQRASRLGVYPDGNPNAAEAPKAFSCHLARDFGGTPCYRDCGKLRCMYPSQPAAEAPKVEARELTDAQRYQWLRRGCLWANLDKIMFNESSDGRTWKQEAGLDKAIDAAIEASTTKGKS